jgi:hypothetical protein
MWQGLIAIIVFGLVMAYGIISEGETDETMTITVIPPMPQYSPVVHIEQDAYDDAWCEFTNLFNSYEVKRAKNGALMIRRGNSGPYKFCKKG